MFRLVYLFAFAALAWAFPFESEFGSRDCEFPNGTDTHMFSYNCDNTDAIQVIDVEVYDAETGEVMYPVDLTRKVIIKMNAQNNGDVYEDNKNDVQIHKYEYSWWHGKCIWSKLAISDVLNNIEGCDFAHNCPLQKGPLTLNLPLDLTDFKKIIPHLILDIPHQLTVKMYDANHQKQISCVVAQLKFATK